MKEGEALLVVVVAAVGGSHGHSLHVLQSRHPCITTLVHFQD